MKQGRRRRIRRNDPPAGYRPLRRAFGAGGGLQSSERIEPGLVRGDGIMTKIVRSLCGVLLLGAPGRMVVAEDGAVKDGPRPNMVGAYGPWLSEKVLGDGPARL